MKKNDVLLIISVALYSFLFYKQALGINFLIFSVLLTSFLMIRDTSVLKNKLWIAAAGGSIISGLCIAIHGTGLAYFANIFSLSLMSAFSISRKSTVILSILYSTYSYITSIGFMIYDFIERRQQKVSTKTGNFWLKFLIYTAIFVVVLIFFLLYRESNVLFKDFTKYINFDFISWRWFWFTFLGFLLLYGFFYHRNFPGWYRRESEASDILNQQAIEARGSKLFGRFFNIALENSSGIILLLILNVMIFTVNMLDVVYLWGHSKLPEGITYSEMVHQSVFNLILSIIIAIFIILFFFRGHLNFYKNNKWLKLFAYLWVIQNIFLVVSTALRNQYYIDEYQLTNKRIGVYVWLVLALIGLITTFIKIMQQKSNWFLFRKNAWAFYGVLLVACFVNWHLFITHYNIKNSKKIDKFYLLSLSYVNIPELIQLNSDTLDFNPDYYYTKYNLLGDSRKPYMNATLEVNFLPALHLKMYDFLKRYDEIKWKSWNYDRWQTFRQIIKMDEQNQLSKIYLFKFDLKSLQPLKHLKNITYLNFSGNNLDSLSELKYFPQLTYLDISSNRLNSLNGIPKMEQLKQLNLKANSISDFNELTNIPKLQQLNISSNNSIKLQTLPNLDQLKVLDISNNMIDNYAFLKKYTNLEELYLSGAKNRQIDSFPVLSQLKKIDISNNNISNYNMDLFFKIAQIKELKELNLENNEINNLIIITSAYDDNPKAKSNIVKPMFPYLTDLNVGSNKFTNLQALLCYTNLKKINLSNNEIFSFDHLQELTNLEELTVSGCKNFYSFEEIVKLQSLHYLDASSCNITDLKLLSQLNNLKELYLNNNQITDISGIEKLTKLEKLNLNNNSIENLNPLLNLKSLKVLRIMDNQVQDNKIFLQMTHLKELYITSSDQVFIEQLEKALPNTYIEVFGPYSYQKTILNKSRK